MVRSDVTGESRRRASTSPTLETLVAMGVASVLRWVTGPAGAFLFVLAPPVAVRPWAIVTSVYAHAGVAHLLSNALALALVGIVMEQRTTRLRFHAFFVGVGALAGLAQITLGSLVAGGVVGVLGASGAVFGCLGYLLTSNRLAGGVLDRLPVSRSVTAVLLVVAAGALAVLWSPPGSALVAHFTGLVVGLGAGRIRLVDT
jgi:membrane associated rhomboid family serine protease